MRSIKGLFVFGLECGDGVDVDNGSNHSGNDLIFAISDRRC